MTATTTAPIIENDASVKVDENTKLSVLSQNQTLAPTIAGNNETPAPENIEETREEQPTQETMVVREDIEEAQAVKEGTEEQEEAREEEETAEEKETQPEKVEMEVKEAELEAPVNDDIKNDITEGSEVDDDLKLVQIVDTQSEQNNVSPQDEEGKIEKKAEKEESEDTVKDDMMSDAGVAKNSTFDGSVCGTVATASSKTSKRSIRKRVGSKVKSLLKRKGSQDAGSVVSFAPSTGGETVETTTTKGGTEKPRSKLGAFLRRHGSKDSRDYLPPRPQKNDETSSKPPADDKSKSDSPGSVKKVRSGLLPPRPPKNNEASSNPPPAEKSNPGSPGSEKKVRSGLGRLLRLTRSKDSQKSSAKAKEDVTESAVLDPPCATVDVNAEEAMEVKRTAENENAIADDTAISLPDNGTNVSEVPTEIETHTVTENPEAGQEENPVQDTTEMEPVVPSISISNFMNTIGELFAPITEEFVKICGTPKTVDGNDEQQAKVEAVAKDDQGMGCQAPEGLGDAVKESLGDAVKEAERMVFFTDIPAGEETDMMEGQVLGCRATENLGEAVKEAERVVLFTDVSNGEEPKKENSISKSFELLTASISEQIESLTPKAKAPEEGNEDAQAEKATMGCNAPESLGAAVKEAGRMVLFTDVPDRTSQSTEEKGDSSEEEKAKAIQTKNEELQEASLRTKNKELAELNARAKALFQEKDRSMSKKFLEINSQSAVAESLPADVNETLISIDKPLFAESVDDKSE